MDKVSLKSIKYENVKSILAAVVGVEKISRATVSKKTGLSLVTVGKIADVLIRENVVSEYKETRQSAGRRAGMLSINKNRFAVLLDVRKTTARVIITGINLEIKQITSRDIDKSISMEENLRLLVSETMVTLLSQYDFNDCIGVGVIGREERATGVKIMKSFFPDQEIVANSSLDAAGVAALTLIEHSENKNVLYLSMKMYSANGAYMMGNNSIWKSEGVEFGKIMLADGEMLNDKLTKAKSAEEYNDYLSLIIAGAGKIIPTDAIVIECEKGYDIDEVVKVFRAKMEERCRAMDEKMPEIIGAPHDLNGERVGRIVGMTLQIRNKWLEKIVYGADND